MIGDVIVESVVGLVYEARFIATYRECVQQVDVFFVVRDVVC